MSDLFLETSALLRLVLKEEGGVGVEKKLLQASRVVASRLLKVETDRCLIRIALDRPDAERLLPVLRHQLQGIWARMTFIEMTRELCEVAGRVAPTSRLRTLDAIHLATFQFVRRSDPSIEMLTFDERLLAEV